MEAHLRFSRVLVGLDEDLADADVFAHGPQRRLHGLAGPQDGHTRDLSGNKTRGKSTINRRLIAFASFFFPRRDKTLANGL